MQKIIALLSFIIIFFTCIIAIADAYSNNQLPIHYNAALTPILNNNDPRLQKVWKAIKNKSLLLNSKEKALPTSSDLLLLANSDYANILAILQNYGYYGGKISIMLNGKEVHNISAVTIFNSNNSIIITVKPSQIYHIGTISVKGVLPQTIFKLHSGDIAEATDIKQLSIDAINDLKNEGYSEAKIINQQLISYDSQNRVDFFLTIAKGRKIYFNQIKVINNTGNPNLTNSYIARLSGFSSGVLVTPKTIDEYRKNLEELNLFNSIVINQEPSNRYGMADLTLIVTEKPKHNFSVGVNYDTKNGFGSEIGWLNRNLRGLGDQLTLKGSINSLYTLGLSKPRDVIKHKNDYNYDYKLDYDVPAITNYNMHLAMGAHGASEHTIYYSSKSLDGKIGLYKVLKHHWLASAYLNVAKIKDDSVILHNRNFYLAGIDGTFGVDWRDDTLEPHKGYLWNLRINPLFDIKTSHILSRLEIEGRTYIPIDAKKEYILALRGQYGVILGTNLKNIPSNMQYYAGGGNSLRGFRYRSVGLPVYLDNTTKESAIGGISMGLFSAELRAHLYNNFSGVAFIDTAIIGSRAFSHSQTKTGVGIGIRYKSPIGSIRFDVATPLKHNKTDGKFQLYMGIGEAF